MPYKYESDGGKREGTGTRLRKYTYTLISTIGEYIGKVKYQDREYTIDKGVNGLRDSFNWSVEIDDGNDVQF
jgi:hypothetical protein